MQEPRLFYITVATRPHKVLDALNKRVHSQNETLHVLGLEENRLIGWESHQNFGLKLKLVAEFIKRRDLQDNDVVLFTDAYDVAYYGNKENTMTRFLEYQKPIVFGCERFCNPDPELAQEYRVLNVEFPFLNSGMFIGRVWALRSLLDSYSYQDSDDDQRFWTRHFLDHPEKIALDYENRLFLNTAGVDESQIRIENGTISYHDKQPLFIHVNGPDKGFIDYFIGKGD